MCKTQLAAIHSTVENTSAEGLCRISFSCDLDVVIFIFEKLYPGQKLAVLYENTFSGE